MRRDISLIIYATVMAWLASGLWLTRVVHAQDLCTIGHEEEELLEQDADVREEANQPLFWRSATIRAAAGSSATLHVKLLAINDFHGQLGAGRKVAGRDVGSAPVLVSYLQAAQAGIED